jgi:hypothetical protein
MTAAALALLLLACAGCGGARRPARRAGTVAAPAPCSTRVRAVLARTSGIATAEIVSTPFQASSGAAACRLGSQSYRRAPTAVVSIDTAPQPYERLEREIEETGQVFTPTRLIPAPVEVPRLGLDAAWFPSEHKAMTTDGRRLITVSVAWRGVGQRREQALATAMAHAVLGS